MEPPKKPTTKRKGLDNNTTVDEKTNKQKRSERIAIVPIVAHNATDTIERTTNPDEPRETHVQDQPGRSNTTSNEEEDDCDYDTDAEDDDLTRERAVLDARRNHTYSHYDESTETPKDNGEQREKPMSKKRKKDRAMKPVLYGTKGYIFVHKSNRNDNDFIVHRGGENQSDGNLKVFVARDKAFVESKYHRLSNEEKQKVRNQFIKDFNGRWLKPTADNEDYYFIVAGEMLSEIISHKFSPRTERKKALIKQIEEAEENGRMATGTNDTHLHVVPVVNEYSYNVRSLETEENNAPPPVAPGATDDPRNIITFESPVAPAAPDHPDDDEDNDAPPPLAAGVTVDPRNIITSESPVAPEVPDHPDNIEDNDEMDYEQEEFFRESSARVVVGSHFLLGTVAPEEREREDDTTALDLKIDHNIDQLIEFLLDGITCNGNVEESIRSSGLEDYPPFEFLPEFPPNTSNMGDQEFYTSHDNSPMESAALLQMSELESDVVDVQAYSLQQGTVDIESHFDITEEIEDIVLLAFLRDIFQSTDEINHVVSLPPDSDSHVFEMD